MIRYADVTIPARNEVAGFFAQPFGEKCLHAGFFKNGRLIIARKYESQEMAQKQIKRWMS